MSASEERSDELKWHVYGISSLRGGTSVQNVAAAGFDTYSNGVPPLRLASLVAALSLKFAGRVCVPQSLQER